MSTQSIRNEGLIVYPAQGVLTLISQAWNLLLANLKDSLLIVLAPTLLLSLFQLLMSTLSSQTFLTPTTGNILAGNQFIALLGALVGIPAFFIWALSCCTLSRLYYSAITQNKPLSLRDCWQYTGQHWLPISGLVFILSICTAIMILVNFLVLFLGIALTTTVIGALSLSAGGLNSMGPGVMMFLFLLVVGFVILSLMIGLATFQGFFFVFPLVAIATAPTSPTAQPSLLQTTLKAYRMLFRHLPRLIPFALALFAFSSVLTAVLLSPVWVWTALEMARLGLNQQHYIPMHIQGVMNIASSLSNLLILPFHISAVTLLWYDCQVRAEGLDLRLWFNDLLNRREKQPSDFGTEVL